MNSPEKPYLKLLQRQETKLEDGVTLLTTTYEREDGNAFAAYFLIVAPGKAYLLTGTANCGYGTIDCTALVPEQMASVRQEGHDVLAGINCGYFRRKDHCRPYGLSIRNGIEIAPPYSEPRLTISNIELGRRWLGVTADHRIIHGTDETYPAHKDELVFAASFTHFLVQNGQSITTRPFPAWSRGQASACARTVLSSSPPLTAVSPAIPWDAPSSSTPSC